MSEATSKSELPIDRLIAILEKISEMNRSTTASEMAGLLKVPTPTTHRMVTQLVERELLKHAIGSKRLLPGPRLLKLAVNALESSFLADRTHAHVSNLASELEEQCHVGVISNDRVRYIASATSGRSSGLLFEPGQSAPIYCTSTGKLFLANMSSEESEWWIYNHELKAMTDNTITDKHELMEQISDIRTKNWATTLEELVKGVIGYAVPIRNSQGVLVAALGVSIPVARMELHEPEVVIQKLVHTAGIIRNELE